MSNKNLLLEKIKLGNASYSDLDNIFLLNLKELVDFFSFAQEITRKNFNNTLKIYNPNKKFPAISITGTECALQCEHCDKKYLKGMKEITSVDELYNFLFDFSKNEGVGVLLSGGCDANGAVPLLNYLDVVKLIKERTNLIINTHTGLLNEITAKKLAEANVDIVSIDINMDEEIMKNIYHLNKDLDEYKRVIKVLKKYNLNIVPHICVGLHYGITYKELESIKFVKDSGINPSLIVLIALIPPKGSLKFKKPEPIDIAKVILIIRFLFPETEISLGCMRPRKDIREEIEILAIKAGINRIELPSRKTLKWARNFNPNVNFEFYSACCAIPRKCEKFAKSKSSDIKGYQNL